MGGEMNMIKVIDLLARVVESWPFIAACWAALVAFAVFGGAL